jgi:hypothetical protein
MGFWLLDADDRALFVVGALLEGLLNLAGEKHPVRARVRNISRDRVGCEFEDLLDTTQKGIAKFLDPTTLGAELRPIPSAEAGTLWYHGPSGTDLLLKRKTDGQFDQLCLYFLERFVRWDTEEGLVTGTSEASSEPCEIRGILRLETLLLHLDSSQDSDKLRIAKTIILSSNLSQDLKSWCVRQLER